MYHEFFINKQGRIQVWKHADISPNLSKKMSFGDLSDLFFVPLRLKYTPMTLLDWLPITKKETDLRGWDEVDIVFVTGDAYVDHPAFGAAVIGRVLEHNGFRVALIPQPNWRDDLREFKKFGTPRLYFGVSAGCMDSMVNHYTANKRLRSNDAYTPGGEAGFRPDRATVVYCNILKQLYPDVPIIVGGIEASLRRVTHYDYWDDCLKPSILVDSKADLGVYGMGEYTMVEIAKAIQNEKKISELTDIKQTFFLQDKKQPLPAFEGETIELMSHEVCLKDKKKYASNFRHIEEESNKKHAARLIQEVGNQRLIINPPLPTFTTEQIDASFDLPYTRLPHPKYAKRGVIPAYEMIRHSVNLHRGCFLSCKKKVCLMSVSSLTFLPLWIALAISTMVSSPMP